MKRIVFTGGGTAGHVTPNLALLPHFIKNGWDVHYVGTHDGIEKTLITPVEGVTYHAIHSGKLRRYFDIKNFTDPFRVLQGAFEAERVMRKLRPNVLFSKGGFVSVPVVYGAWLHRVPAVLHESDMTPGLANKITVPCAKAICTTFPETAKMIGKKAVYTGTPLRPSLFLGSAQKGLSFLGFDGKKPVLTMMGGSTGAASVNRALRASLDRLLPRFDVAHICGKGNVDKTLEKPGYRQLEYVAEELADVLAATGIMLSRAGANSLCEILALRKAALLIPYPLGASRGDQIANAASFEKRGFSSVLPQEQATPEALMSALFALWENRGAYRKAMEAEPIADGTIKIIDVIMAAAKGL
jgi:UDP-N-acetylglucosamine--N-acetylmuramyl-(pentapeptide) pyrophosphoryl-undecaprenol N-acetylglucosamine transferase